MRPLKIISSMASREVLKELGSRYQSQHDRPVELEAIGGVEATKRVRAGEVVDVVVLARNSIDALATGGALIAASITDIAQSGISVAVKAGAPRVDISSEEAVQRAILSATSLSYSTGPSGVYLERKFEAWGILTQLRPRIVVPPPGMPVATLITSGKVSLGFQQLSELINVEGITVLGPLPPPLQLVTIFSGAVAATSDAATAAAELLKFMAAPETAALKAHFGMEPCAPVR
jgi:molybdate transport system substrate-binding protein